MKDPKFTPGPWHAKRYVGASWEEYYEVSTSDGLRIAISPTEADARLIAAAPEMYDFIEYLTTETGHSLLSQAGYLGENLYNEAKELCRKARGESEMDE